MARKKCVTYAQVQGLPDRRRKISCRKGKGAIEVYRISTYGGRPVWSTDIARGERILDMGYTKLTKRDLREL